MINVTLLGSTGSIGTSTLDVIRRHPGRFRLFALAANSSVDSLLEQILEFRPEHAVLVDAGAADALRARLAASLAALAEETGADELTGLAPHLGAAAELRESAEDGGQVGDAGIDDRADSRDR